MEKWADNVIEQTEISSRDTDIDMQLRHKEGAGQVLGCVATLRPHVIK